MNWHGVHGADWVEAGTRAQPRHSNSVQNALRDWCGDVHVWVGSMVGGLVVAGVSWGCGKNVMNLKQNPPNAHANPTTPQQIACLCEDLLLWVTQGGAVHTDGVTQKGNSTGGCDVVARASRTEGRPRVVPECPGAQRRGEGVTRKGKCWSRKNEKKGW